MDDFLDITVGGTFWTCQGVRYSGYGVWEGWVRLVFGVEASLFGWVEFKRRESWDGLAGVKAEPLGEATMHSGRGRNMSPSHPLPVPIHLYLLHPTHPPRYNTLLICTAFSPRNPGPFCIH